MGSSQSAATRTATIENPNDFVKITDDVVQRIRGQHAKNDGTTLQKPTAIHNDEPSSIPSSYGNVPQNPAVFYGEPTITALEVRRQKEKELRNNDAYWAMRLAQQEKTLQKTNAILEKEYDAAVNSVRNHFQNASPQLQLPPCRDVKQKVIDCYKQYPNETLKCGSIVAEFTDCVITHRTKILDEKQKAASK